MYFQDILQGIASNLMDSNSFQLKSSTFCKTYRWVPVTWGFLPTYFQASVGLVFWEYQTGSLIWVIGHWLRLGQRLSCFEPKCTRKGVHVKVNTRKFWTDCVKFWHIFSIKRDWKKNWPKKQDSLHPSLPPHIDLDCPPTTMRPFFKGQNNQKLCLSVILWYPTVQVSFVLFTLLYSSFFVGYSIPQTFTMYQILAISLLAMFFGKLFTGLLLTIF